jgi:hypothetical protein
MDYSCVPCNRHFGSQKALEQHQQNSPRHKESFGSQETPEQHQEDAPLPKETLYCGICKFNLSSKEIFEEHQRDLHMDKKNFHCQTCNLSFVSKGTLEQHQRDSPRHKETSHYETFDPGSSDDESDEHQQDAPLNEETFYCKICDRYFGSKLALEMHQRDSARHKETFYCQICNLYFGSKEVSEQHQRDSHMHKENFQCMTCNGSFDNARSLRYHRRDCEVHQAYSEDYLGGPLDRRGGEASSSNARVRLPPLDMPALIQQFQAQSLASANPVATTPLPKKGKGKAPEPIHETRELFMFPELHASIAEAVWPEITSTWFQGNSDDDDFDNEWPSYVMGRFICKNDTCESPGWGSKKVPIEIRGYNGNGYSAVVYNQRCKLCDWLGTFVLNKQSYIDRVTYWLKSWAGVSTPRPPGFGVKKGPPHEEDFCEGCKRGRCRDGNDSAINY